MTDDRPVCLITGASGGIGGFLAEHLLARGFTVVGCGRKPCELQEPDFHYKQTDVTDEKQVKSLLRFIEREHHRLDAVINCAAVSSMNHFLLTPAQSVEKMLSTSVTGTFIVSREAAKLMRKRGFGRIVNFSSIAVPLRLAGQSAYVAAKASVESLSQVVAKEVADYGVTVNVIGAAPLETGMTRGVPPETLDRLVQSLPLKRIGTFDDVANVVDFFLSRESGAVTGQVLYLGGVPNV